MSVKNLSLKILLVLLLAVSGVYAQETVEYETGFRLFEHELLATEPLCIPDDPQRIAFIDSSIAYGVALGIDSVTQNYYFNAFLGDFPALPEPGTHPLPQRRIVGA